MQGIDEDDRSLLNERILRPIVCLVSGISLEARDLNAPPENARGKDSTQAVQRGRQGNSGASKEERPAPRGVSRARTGAHTNDNDTGREKSSD